MTIRSNRQTIEMTESEAKGAVGRVDCLRLPGAVNLWNYFGYTWHAQPAP
jgi:hypothetical protein